MANIASAKKRIRSSNRRSVTNKNRISAIRTYIKKVEEAIANDKKADARKALQLSESQMMVGAGKGKVSKKRMMKMLLTGDPIDARYAKEIGLINDHYPKSQLNNEVLFLARKIAAKSNLTIKIGKKAFYKQSEMSLRKAYKFTSKVMTENMMAMDAKEGISAFLEKRKPKWKNK